MTQELVRRKDALVNVNYADYQAAKARRKQESYVIGLEQRINKLESTVDELCEIISNCKRDSQ